MNWRSHLLQAGILCLLLGFTLPCLLGAASPREGKANWDNLRQLAPSDQIKIVLNDAKSYSGQFQTLSDEAIVVRLTSGEQTFPKETVLRVSTKGQSHRGRNAFVGLAAGAGAGVIVSVASPELGTGTCGRGSCVDAGMVSGLALVGGALGAGIGALIPTGGWHDVYRAR